MALTLYPVGRFGVGGSNEWFDIIYAVQGMRPDEYCLVVYAGIAVAGGQRWAISWFRSGERRAVLQEIHDSPESALRTIEEFWAALADSASA